jgi:hypothetical protein
VLRRHLEGGAEQGGVDRRSSRGLAKPEGDMLSRSASRPLSRDVCRFAVRICDRTRSRSGQGDRALEVGGGRGGPGWRRPAGRSPVREGVQALRCRPPRLCTNEPDCEWPGTGSTMSLLDKILGPFISQSTAAAAQPALFAATSPKVAPSGYYGPKNVSEMKGPLTEPKIAPQAG